MAQLLFARVHTHTLCLKVVRRGAMRFFFLSDHFLNSHSQQRILAAEHLAEHQVDVDLHQGTYTLRGFLLFVRELTLQDYGVNTLSKGFF